MPAEITTTPLRRAVLVVAVLNVFYGIIEFAVALVIGWGASQRHGAAASNSRCTLR